MAKTRLLLSVAGICAFLISGVFAQRIACGAPANNGKTNLVPNPGFEETDAEGNLAGWDLNGKNAVCCRIDTKDAASGRYSLRITRLDDQGPPSAAFIGLSELIPVEPGTGYTLSFYTKFEPETQVSSSFTSPMFVEVWWYNEKKERLSTLWTQQGIPDGYNKGRVGILAGKGFSDWGRFCTEITTKPEAHYAKIWLARYQSKGSTWYDDVQFEKGNEPSPFKFEPPKTYHEPKYAW